MEKKLLVGLALVFITGTAFAQTPGDSSKVLSVPQQFPPLQYKADWNKLAYKPDDLLKKKSKLFRKSPQATADPKEDVTLFYSNMPMARVDEKRQKSRMPIAKPDSSTHYHLLKKQYKVVPIPEESSRNSGKE